MTSNRLLCAAVVALAVCAVAGADSPATQPVTFHRDIPVGTCCDFDRAIQMDIQSTEQSEASPVVNHSSQATVHIQGRLTVTAVADGLPSAVRIVFAPDTDSGISVDGKPMEHIPIPFSGLTVNVRRMADGKVLSDFKGRTDPGTIQQLDSLLELDGGMLPARPVVVGQQWDADPADVRRALQLGDNDQGSIHCRLVAVKDDPAAGPVAQLEVTQVADQHPSAGSATKMVLKGAAEVVLSTGLAVTQQLAGEVDLHGAQLDRAGAEHRLRGAGHVDEHQVLALVPSGPQPASDALLGTFRDDRLVVRLDRAPAGGYTGTLLFNGQTLPLQARGAPDHLQGTFQSGGASFQFTANLDQDQLILTTDGAVYHLRRSP